MKIEVIASWVIFFVSLAWIYFGFMDLGLTGILAALIFYTRYDIKCEIKREMGVEQEVFKALHIRADKVEKALKEREAVVDDRLNR